MIFQDKKLFSQSLNYIKNFFEKLIKLYVKITPKSSKKRKVYSDLIIYIYNNIEDDYNIIKNNIKLNSFKEIDNLFNKFKENKYKFRLYNEEIINTDISINNKNNNKNINKTPEKKEKKEKNNINNLIINTNINPDANDILSLIPNEFFEYHFFR